MNAAVWLCVFLPLLLILFERRQKNYIAAHRILRKQKERQITMTEVIKRYIGQECVIDTINTGARSSSITGIIRELQDGWIIVGRGAENEAINLEYVVRCGNIRAINKARKKRLLSISTTENNTKWAHFCVARFVIRSPGCRKVPILRCSARRPVILSPGVV